MEEDYLAIVLSGIRILATPLVVYALINYPLGYLATLIFLIFAVTDMADGAARIIAKKQGRSAKIGKSLDVIADRIFFTAVILVLMIKYNPFLILILTREIITLPSFVALAMKKNKKQLKEVGQKTPVINKLATFMQAATITALLVNTTFSLSVFPYFIAITAIMGIISGINYLKKPVL